MSDTTPAVDSPGRASHPEHPQFLTALGRATYAAAGLAKACMDILRILGPYDSAELYDDPLGTLETRLIKLARLRPDLHELPEFLAALTAARVDRNDLIHAFPVQQGLYRRRTKDAQYVRTFYTVESLDACAQTFEDARRLGNAIVHRDGGAEIALWRERLEEGRAAPTPSTPRPSEKP